MPAAHSLVQELHESFSRKGYKRLVSPFPIPLSLAWMHDAPCKPHTHGITIHRGSYNLWCERSSMQCFCRPKGAQSVILCTLPA